MNLHTCLFLHALDDYQEKALFKLWPHARRDQSGRGYTFSSDQTEKEATEILQSFGGFVLVMTMNSSERWAMHAEGYC